MSSYYPILTQATTGNIDGYPPLDGWAPFMLGFTTYLYDVEPGGGAFIYWPDSNLRTRIS